VTLRCFASVKGSVIDYHNKNDLDRHYDLSQEFQEQRDLEFLCNQVVHSYVFVIATDEDGAVVGFFVASDRIRHHKVYHVSLADVIRIFRTVGRDYPSTQTLERDPLTHQWREV
jgi:hypothetical protein